MAGLYLRAFGGYVPRVSPTLLQDNEAQDAVNVRLYSGALESWRKVADAQPVVTVGEFTQTIYRVENASGDSRWICWNGDVDVVDGPIVDTQSFRLYYTGDGSPKKTNTTLTGSVNGSAPLASLEMGVWRPGVAPVVTRNSSGTALVNNETRVYIYTNISTFGDITEESAPSDLVTVTKENQGDTFTIGLPADVGSPAGKNYNITHRRIYRSTTGTSSTSFQFVAEVSIGTTSYTDSLNAEDLGEQLQSMKWVEPPEGLSGLVALPNGFLAGFVGNEIFFSEPNYPHAWPLDYVLSVGTPIVALGVFGQSLVVMTESYPFIVSGITPQSMTQEKLPIVEPCVSKRSVASDSGGVFYASPNGLVLIGPGGPQLATQNLFTRTEWNEYYPQSMIGKVLNGKYFAFYTAPGNIKAALILDRNVSGTPLSRTNVHTFAPFVDTFSSSMYVVSDNKIKIWDGDQNNVLPYEWKSKRFVFPRPINFGVIQVEADFGNTLTAAEINAIFERITNENQATWNSGVDLEGVVNGPVFNERVVNGSLLQELPQTADDRYVQITAFADGIERFRGFINNSGMFRLPSGFKADNWEFVINGNIPLRYIKIAETVKELKSL